MVENNDYPFPKRQDLRKEKGRLGEDDVSVKLEKNNEKLTSPFPKRQDLRKEPLEEKGAKGRRPKAVIAIILACLLIALLIFFGIFAYNKNQDVMVPEADNFISETSRGADPCQIFIDSGLKCVKEEEFSKLEKNTLISQSLPTGTIAKKGDLIILSYSIGSNIIKVPNLTGMTVEDAIEELNSMGLEFAGTIEVDNTDVPKDTIINSAIKDGSIVRNGTKIYVNVSNGSFIMPDWIGLTKEEVILSSEKLKVDVSFEEEDSEQPSNIIISQVPEKGVKVNNDDKITVIISKQKESTELTVPDIVGMTEENAQIELALAGFKHIKVINENNTNDANNSIIETIPAAGEKITSDKTITLVKSEK